MLSLRQHVVLVALIPLLLLGCKEEKVATPVAGTTDAAQLCKLAGLSGTALESCTAFCGPLDCNRKSSEQCLAARRDYQAAQSTRKSFPCDPQWRLTDATGRETLHHGLNLAYKTPNREMTLLGVGTGNYSTPITLEELVKLRRDAGFNQMRLLVTWSTLEPEKGKYSQEMIDEVVEFVDLAHQAGMTVLVDFHQGLYGVYTEKNATGLINRLGNGAPAWATLTDGLEVDLTQPWPHNYWDEGVSRAFDNFWNYEKHPELQDHFLGAVTRVAAALKGHPGLIGYDIMNEPFAGTTDPKEAEPKNIQPFYERFIASLRSVDENAWIFYEPLAENVNQGKPTYLTYLDDPRAGGRRLVYTPHFYLIPELAELPYWRPLSGMGSFRNNLIRAQRTLESPVLLDEFRIKNTFWNWEEAFEEAVAMFDELGSGWSYWAWMKGPVVTKRLDEDPPLADLTPLIAPDGSEQGHTWAYLVRPYPQAVSGEITTTRYDMKTRRMDLSFVTRPNVEGPTEIFIPARTYPEGWSLRISGPEGSYRSEFDSEWNILRVWTDNTQASRDIVIEPKS